MAFQLPPIPQINGEMYSWVNIAIGMLGQSAVREITEFDYPAEESMIEQLHGGGSEPIGFGVGQIKYAESRIQAYFEFVEALRKIAPRGKLTRIPAFDITVSYSRNEGAQRTTDIVTVKIKKYTVGLKKDNIGVLVDITLETLNVQPSVGQVPLF